MPIGHMTYRANLQKLKEEKSLKTTYDVTITGHNHYLGKRVYSAVLVILALICDGHESFSDCELLYLSPRFRRVQLINAPSPLIVLIQGGRVNMH